MADKAFTNPVPIEDLPDEWQIADIDSLCEKVTSGGTPLRGTTEYYEGGTIPWIKTKELKDWYIDDAEEKITELALENSSAKIFPQNTVLMAMYGDGRTITSLGLLRKEAATNQACCAMIVNPQECNYLYLFYALKYHRSDFLLLAIGGAQRNLSGTLIRNFAIRKPPIPEQRAIAGMLGALDDKIELNRRMNRTLESMARGVFHQWFVESEEVEEWEVGQVKDLGEVITGKTPPTTNRENYDGETPFITIPDMHGKMFVIETGKTLSEKGVQTQRNKTLPPFSICISCIATPGLVSMTTEPSQTNQQINSLIPNDEKSAFYSFFALRELGDEIRARGGGGSVLLNLNKGQFETMPILIPPIDLMHKFQVFAEPLLMRLLANEKESRTLASLRDSLLPKLMRGEVRVK